MKRNKFILDILKKNYPEKYEDVYNKSYLIQYIDKKTNSVGKSSKARPSFANLYAIYVLVEDYLKNGYYNSGKYIKEYDGMIFSKAFKRQRELPFGEKLQNHALNNRCNHEFSKYFNKVTSELPIVINQSESRYFINEKLLLIKLSGEIIDISKIIIEIIDRYVELKKEKFDDFFEKCSTFSKSYMYNEQEAIQFIESNLDENADARIFEIISFLICKYYYYTKTVYFGVEKDSIKKCRLSLYKTGRTNANDGGIDFIMKPIGRIFQVTEVLDFKKYFLDIEKLNKFPITFIVKTEKKAKDVMNEIETQAKSMYDEKILERYLSCFEEIITLRKLRKYLNVIIEQELLDKFFIDLIKYCKIEYNV
ncbi:restriction endonuclease [Clostridium perfringens]|uniref:hypothetical protein n=1 Tax=Clostridium perfringens TaxID=1502 RepID=UPI002AC49829|nr:hypothetical protein [Clostridium perfringens]MDZ5148588.1 restriction endonuclease [Clostridium perfringens]